MRIAALLIFGCIALSAIAAEKAVGSFYAASPSANVPELSGAFAGRTLYYQVKGHGLSTGEHRYKATFIDGNGREAFTASLGVKPRKNGSWVTTLHYTCKNGLDVSGTWWFVSELDGEPLLSQSLKVECTK